MAEFGRRQRGQPHRKVGEVPMRDRLINDPGDTRMARVFHDAVPQRVHNRLRSFQHLKEGVVNVQQNAGNAMFYVAHARILDEPG